MRVRDPASGYWIHLMRGFSDILLMESTLEVLCWVHVGLGAVFGLVLL